MKFATVLLFAGMSLSGFVGTAQEVKLSTDGNGIGILFDHIPGQVQPYYKELVIPVSPFIEGSVNRGFQYVSSRKWFDTMELVIPPQLKYTVFESPSDPLEKLIEHKDGRKFRTLNVVRRVDTTRVVLAKKEKWGAINFKGEEVIPFENDSFSVFNGRPYDSNIPESPYFVLFKSGALSIRTGSGKLIFPFFSAFPDSINTLTTVERAVLLPLFFYGDYIVVGRNLSLAYSGGNSATPFCITKGSFNVVELKKDRKFLFREWADDVSITFSDEPHNIQGKTYQLTNCEELWNNSAAKLPVDSRTKIRFKAIKN